MTTNPTPAEVQAAYDNAVEMLERKHFALTDDVKILLAAVKRDTLGWRVATTHETLALRGTLRIHINRDDALVENQYWIKDAAP